MKVGAAAFEAGATAAAVATACGLCTFDLLQAIAWILQILLLLIELLLLLLDQLRQRLDLVLLAARLGQHRTCKGQPHGQGQRAENGLCFMKSRLKNDGLPMPGASHRARRKKRGPGAA